MGYLLMLSYCRNGVWLPWDGGMISRPEEIVAVSASGAELEAIRGITPECHPSSYEVGMRSVTHWYRGEAARQIVASVVNEVLASP